jgi:hypothetical protein
MNNLLDITTNSDWIAAREKLWKPIGDDFKKDFRKKEIEKIHHYFMTGVLDSDYELTDVAKFSWFPIQTPAGWDYVLQYLIKEKKSFEKIFYFSLGDLSNRAMNEAEQLDLWDYFLGDSFQPTITSRVGVGKEGKPVVISVNHENVASEFNLNLGSWIKGYYGNNPKWKNRFNYFLTMLPHMISLEFTHLADDGEFDLRVEYLIENIFRSICNPPYGEYEPLDGNALLVRQDFITDAIKKIDLVEMPPAMKKVWLQTKSKA